MHKCLFQQELCLPLQNEVKFYGKFKQQVHKVKYKPVQYIYVQHIHAYIYIYVDMSELQHFLLNTHFFCIYVYEHAHKNICTYIYTYIYVS